ncbi:nuclear transport factor 2 family protein [Arthrobacter koreensis]|uniref:nuclear transport factor 2 family protein n=1 Tax=Arthrobacter koreensis TaxID=199136 RepID=UPI003AC9308B
MSTGKEPVTSTMAETPHGVPASGEDLVATYHLYGRQSHAIDSGDAAGWAATFTADGTFTSPTYPAPAEGREALTRFAERFAADCRRENQVLRHVVSTVHVEQLAWDALRSHAYLQIIGTAAGQPPRLHRITVVEDDLVRTPAGLLVAARRVRPD